MVTFWIVQTISPSTGVLVEVRPFSVTFAVALSPPPLSSSSVVPWIPDSGSFTVALPAAVAGPFHVNVLLIPVEKIPAGFTA